MIDPTEARRFMEEQELLNTIGEQTPYQDKNGKDIFVGDLVDYYFAGSSISNDPADGSYADSETDGHTLIEDVVVKYHGKYYFVDPAFGGGFAWRHATHCEVKGTLIKKEVENE